MKHFKARSKNLLAAIYVPAMDIYDDAMTTTYDRAMRLGDLLAARDTPGVSYGELVTANFSASDDKARRILFGAELTHLDWIATWANWYSDIGYATMLYMVANNIGQAGHIDAPDFGLLPGYGVGVGSAGLSGLPLVGMPLARLREELVVSRQKLSKFAGYEINFLCPRENDFGMVVDPLVIGEAKRAGYKYLWIRGYQLLDVEALDGFVLTHRWLQPDDKMHNLLDWVAGKLVAKKSAQINYYINRSTDFLQAIQKKNTGHAKP